MMRARLRQLMLGPDPISPADDRRTDEILGAIHDLRLTLVAVAERQHEIGTRLVEADEALRFMVGEVSQLTQRMLGLALASHHDTRIAASAGTTLIERLGHLSELVESERDAIFASNDALAKVVERAVVRPASVRPS